MSTILDQIIAGVREDLDARMAEVPLDELREQIGDLPTPRDPLPTFAAPGLSVIAEVKRSSPSAGELAKIVDPGALALSYVGGGAAAISVLTESRRFGGSLFDLDWVRMKVNVPILRKDFIVDPYQIYETRVHRADICLLIVAALDDVQLGSLYELARSLGLTCLVEVHTVEEARRARALGARLIGVNNRDLTTLQVDLGRFPAIAPELGDEVIRVVESGIRRPFDAARLRRAGADVVLVGSALVTEINPGAMIAAMIGAASAQDSR